MICSIWIQHFHNNFVFRFGSFLKFLCFSFCQKNTGNLCLAVMPYQQEGWPWVCRGYVLLLFSLTISSQQVPNPSLTPPLRIHLFFSFFDHRVTTLVRGLAPSLRGGKYNHSPGTQNTSFRSFSVLLNWQGREQMRKNQIPLSFLFFSQPLFLFLYHHGLSLTTLHGSVPTAYLHQVLRWCLSHLKIPPWILTQPLICSLCPLICFAPDQLLTCLVDLPFQSPCCRH